MQHRESTKPFSTSNTDLTAASMGVATSAEKDDIINWVRGANNMLDDNLSGTTTDTRGFVHGDVLHSRPAIINYNRNSDDIVLFYGVNDGTIDSSQGDKSYVFLSMRRGGRFIYALNVSDPTAPRLLWKHSSADSGFAEMGQTWSELEVAKVRANTNPRSRSSASATMLRPTTPWCERPRPWDVE